MRKRHLALVLVWTLPSVLFIGATASVYFAFRIPPPERLDATERAAIMAPIRAAVEHRESPPCTLHRGGGPVVVTIWIGGRAAARFDGAGPDLGAATDTIAKALREVQLAGWEDARIQVDVITGRAPLGGGQWLFDALAVPGIGEMLAIDPGNEGIGADVGGRAALVLPHELVAAKLLSTKRPSDAVQDFAIGVDLRRIALMVGSRAGLHAPIAATELYRFRTDTFVESPHHAGPPIQLVRGIPPTPALSAKALREAALEGGHYLVAHLSPTGRYIYEHDLATGVMTDPASGNYSMPRHAGTTYFLAELYRITKQEWLREPIERAFAHLATLLRGGACAGELPDGTEFDCVLDAREDVAHLGSTALTIVALVEYQRATGDNRYLPLAHKLAVWIMYMQRPDGSFRHLYNAKQKKPDDDSELLYYSGEASLALARMYLITGDRQYLDAAERGLDWLVGWYDFFLGGFVYFEEHWTCIAAEAIWPAVQKPKYREFCAGYAAFLRTQQAGAGDYPGQDDLAGSYNVTPFVAPYNTPAGSRTEAMISAYLLGEHHGHPDPRIREQITRTLQYALGQQIRPDGDFGVIGPGDGGMPASPIERGVRIDYVQHVCSAMIRASEWLADR
ncbi:MAG: hypothetical protein JWO36_2330 [Myxococcales bacterium]|nr:hypothetical protein [Myxococcales bacterium]